MTEIIAWAVRDETYVHPYYLRRGTWVHEACRIIAEGGELDAASIAFGRTPQRKPEIRTLQSQEYECWMPYVEAYQEWLARNVPAPFVRLAHPAEALIVNRVERYIGHPDQVWLMEDGREAIIDLKTGTAPKSTAIQTAFYDLGLPLERRRYRFALQLRPDEKARLIAYEDRRDYDIARLWVRAYHSAREFTR